MDLNDKPTDQGAVSGYYLPKKIRLRRTGATDPGAASNGPKVRWSVAMGSTGGLLMGRVGGSPLGGGGHIRHPWGVGGWVGDEVILSLKSDRSNILHSTRLNPAEFSTHVPPLVEDQGGTLLHEITSLGVRSPRSEPRGPLEHQTWWECVCVCGGGPPRGRG